MDFLGPLELKCLRAVWTLGDANVHAVLAILDTDRQLAYTTVMTTLDRLEKKQVLARKKSGKSFVYTAVMSESDVRKLAVERFIEEYFDGSRPQLLAHLQTSPVESPAAPAPPRLDPSLL